MSFVIQISKYFSLTALLMLMALGTHAQSKESLEKKRDQLMRDIRYTNELLASAQEGQGQALQQLEALQQKIALRKKLIRTIDQEAVSLQKELEKNEREIARLEQELIDLKSEYSKLVYSSYKNKGADDKLLYVFASDNFYQAWRRMAYMKDLARYQEGQGQQIVENKEVIVAKNEEVAAQKQEKLVLLDEQKKAKAELDRDRKKSEELLEELKNDEQDLKSQLQKQEAERKKLNRAIEKIIADNLKEANKGKSTTGFSLTPEEELSSRSFSQNKGKLPWPVEKGVITGRFGTHPHPVIKGVEVTNNGIDIATDKGADSRAVFEGEVTGIIDIPGSGLAVVVKHGGYRTVYSNLKEVFVEKGQTIETKQVVGQLLADGEQSTAHMEIWQITSQGMKKLDPASWIAK